MARLVSSILLFCAAILAAASPVQAQYGARTYNDRATGESYHVELGGYFWNPAPEIGIVSEGLGIPGDRVDFVTDLGIEQSQFRQLKVVLRPATKHKFRFEYTPIGYEAESTVTREFVFNGQRYRVGLPVVSELQWKAFRFGYEWDFIYRERGFFGLLLEAKYTNVQATLTTNVLGFELEEFAEARAPVPAIGVIGRVYVVPNISITGEFSGIKVPGIGEDERRPDEPRYKANYFDFDLYGTVNFSDHFGAQAGYRSFDVFYKIEDDEGELALKGLYFGGVVRF
jgi:hypothetical protein